MINPKWFLKGLSLFRLTLKPVAESQCKLKEIWANHICILVHIPSYSYINTFKTGKIYYPLKRLFMSHPKCWITNSSSISDTRTALYWNPISAASTFCFFSFLGWHHVMQFGEHCSYVRHSPAQLVRICHLRAASPGLAVTVPTLNRGKWERSMSELWPSHLWTKLAGLAAVHN